jgi:hypothetical protein
VAFGRKFIFQSLKVLDDAVVNHGETAAAIGVGVRVSGRWDPVCSPAGMTDSNAGIVGQTQNIFKIRDLACCFRYINFRAVQRGNAC